MEITCQIIVPERHDQKTDEKIGHSQRNDEVVSDRLQTPLFGHGQDDQHVAKHGDDGEHEEQQGPEVLLARLAGGGLVRLVGRADGEERCVYGVIVGEEEVGRAHAGHVLLVLD